MKRAAACLFVLSAIAVRLAYAETDNEPLILGVLEHHIQGPDSSPSSLPAGEKRDSFQVRILFSKKSSSWVPFQHKFSSPEELAVSFKFFPSRVHWYVAFNGKTTGEFDSTAPATLTQYAAVGLHIPDRGAKLPTIGKLTKQFSGWMNEPGFRPLVLVSHDYTKDPQLWKPSHLSDALLAQCRELFRKVQSTVTLCDDNGQPRSLATFPATRIRNVKTYRCKEGEYLVSLQLDESLNKCEEAAEDQWSNRWFFIDREGNPALIGKEMTLVDAGDYDNDGTSEVIFWQSGYNTDGYVIFYNHFRDHADFTWNYH